MPTDVPAGPTRRHVMTVAAATLGGLGAGAIPAARAAVDIGAGPHACVFGEFEVLPGKEDVMLGLMLAMARDVLAEPGCVLFLPYRFAANTERYHIHEVYKDAAAFEAHLKADHTVAFNNALKSTVVGGASSVEHLVEMS